MMGGGAYLLIFKNNGKFYQIYDIDAYIMHLLFGYKVIDGKSGFPDNSINKIINRLDLEHISYQIIYKDCQHNIIKNFRNKNRYNLVAKNAMQGISIENKIKLMEDKIKNCEIEELERLINLIYEQF